MTDAEYGAAVAGAWNEVVALSIAEKNAKSADGTSYRLEWVAKFAYCRKNNLDQIAGAYCMWQKSPNQKEYKAFVYGGEKEADVGYMQVGVAAAGVSQWNQEHPGQKVKLPDRPAD